MFEELTSDNDTSPEMEALIINKMREMSPTEKIKRMCDLCLIARTMIISGIEKRHHGISEEEKKKYFAAIMLGEEFTKRYYNWDPKDKGY